MAGTHLEMNRHHVMKRKEKHNAERHINAKVTKGRKEIMTAMGSRRA